MKQWIERYLESKKDDLVGVSDFIWENPEIRFKEYKSCEKLTDVLKNEGFSITKNIAEIDTAFMAEFGEEGPIVGFLGEYDALADLSQVSGVTHQEALEGDGIGHGCGHNLLGVGNLGAALATKAYLEENNIPGRVRYYGCPAEEGGSGKTFMARAGAFDDLDLALTWHPGPLTGVWGFNTLANIQAYFKFKGKAAHAAAAPHLGRSALDAVELMNVGVNYLREHMVDDARIHYAITNTGGNSPNVVQAQAEVLQLIRAPKLDQVNSLFERVKKIAEGAALMTETEVEVVFDKACSDYIPNDTLNKVLNESFQELGSIDFTDEEMKQAAAYQATLTKEETSDESMNLQGLNIKVDTPLACDPLPYMKVNKAVPGSTDVGDVSWVTPTAQAVVTTSAFGTPLHTWQMTAQGKTSYAHKGMLYVSKALALTAIKALNDKEIIDKAKEEHKESLGGKAYTSPIPDSVKPNQSH